MDDGIEFRLLGRERDAATDFGDELDAEVLALRLTPCGCFNELCAGLLGES